jgi:hypothetical protein
MPDAPLFALPDLQSCLEINDHSGFLWVYFKQLQAGKRLTVPSSLDPQKSLLEWEEILHFVVTGITPTFLANLNEYWQRIIKKHHGHITPDFASEILQIIQTGRVLEFKPKPKPAPKESKKNLAQEPKEKSSSPEENGDIAKFQEDIPETEELKHMQTTISKSYYKKSQAIDNLPPEKDLLSNMLTYLDQAKFPAFFINYLAQLHYGKNVQLPTSTILDKIISDWQKIIDQQFAVALKKSFKVDLNEDFIKSISFQWFYAVNRVGLPTSKEHIKALIEYFYLKNETPLS